MLMVSSSLAITVSPGIFLSSLCDKVLYNSNNKWNPNLAVLSLAKKQN